MRFEFNDNCTFADFLEAIRENVKSRRESFSLQSAKEEFNLSERLVDEKHYTEAYYRLFRMAFWFDKDIAKEERKFVKKVLDLMDLIKPKVEKEFNKQKKQEDEIRHKNSMDAKRKEEDSARLKLRAQREATANSIRSTIGIPTVSNRKEDVIISHPIAIRYEGRYNSWSMGEKRGRIHCQGIENLGNTCYMNSVIQALNATKLSLFFLTNDISSSLSCDIPYVRLTNEFVRVIQKLNCDVKKSPVYPRSFKDSMGEVYKPFQGISQQDANEFFNVLVDGLHNGLNRRKNSSPAVEIDNSKGSDEALANIFWESYIKNNSSEIVKLFAFQERNVVKCPQCNQIYRSFSPCTGVEVPIAKRQPICVEDCLAVYCREEILDENSLYECGKCKKKVRASQQLTFFTCPEILVLTLKRFSQAGDFASKISTPVIFQPEINLAPFMCAKVRHTQYKLVAIVNHSGSTTGGHYTADICGKGGVWNHCSDEVITEGVKPDFAQAYILFYEKVMTNQL